MKPRCTFAPTDALGAYQCTRHDCRRIVRTDVLPIIAPCRTKSVEATREMRDAQSATASELFDRGFTLALQYDRMAAQLSARGAALATVETIMDRQGICEQCNKFDGRACKLCSGCVGKRDGKFGTQIIAVDGRCLADTPLW